MSRAITHTPSIWIRFLCASVLGLSLARNGRCSLQMRHTLLLISSYIIPLLPRRAGNLKRAVVTGVLEQSLLFDMDNFIQLSVKKKIAIVEIRIRVPG